MKQYIITLITVLFMSGGITSITLGIDRESNLWIISGAVALLIGIVIAIIVIKTRFLDK